MTLSSTQRVLITAGAGGIGSAIATAFAAAGPGSMSARPPCRT